jgi:hypothetical protein
LSSAEKERMIEAFQDEMEDGERKVKKNPRLLVSTLGVLAAGVTLHRAFRLCLLEPHWMSREEFQLNSRIQRIGQENAATYTYRLYTNAEVDTTIMSRQKNRTTLRDASFTARADEEWAAGRT